MQENVDPSKDGRPQWALRNLTNTPWPVGPNRGAILVTAKWGWAAVPTAVKEACLLLSEEYFKLRDAPFGVQQEHRLHGVLEALLLFAVRAVGKGHARRRLSEFSVAPLQPTAQILLV